MKYSVDEFAGEIRKSYPGDYDDLNNERLVDLWLRKYPDDIDKIYLEDDEYFDEKEEPAYDQNKTNYFGWLMTIAIFFILIYTNPDEEKHILEASSSLKRAINNFSTSGLDDEDNLGVGVLGLLFGESLVDGVAPKIISRENYLLFSITTLNAEGNSYKVGIGILDNVIISSKLENKVEEYLSEIYK
jgi:hypothetical protein